MVASFDDLCPEVDEGFLETWRQMHPEHFDKSARPSSRTGEERIKLGSARPLPNLSRDSERVVRALSQRKHWGTNTVSEPTLKNHYCRDIKDLETAIKELVRTGIVIAATPRGPFSLNTKARAQIDLILSKRSTGGPS